MSYLWGCSLTMFYVAWMLCSKGFLIYKDTNLLKQPWKMEIISIVFIWPTFFFFCWAHLKTSFWLHHCVSKLPHILSTMLEMCFVFWGIRVQGGGFTQFLRFFPDEKCKKWRILSPFCWTLCSSVTSSEKRSYPEPESLCSTNLSFCFSLF